MSNQKKDTFELQVADVVYLEAHGVHAPFHAWQVVRQAQTAVAEDTKARKAGTFVSEGAKLYPVLDKLAGVCQKVTRDEASKERFRKLYASAYSQGMFQEGIATAAAQNGSES